MTTSVKYQHFNLAKKNILTICSSLNREALELSFGFTVFNNKDKKYTKKKGNSIALERMTEHPIIVGIPSSEFIFHEFLTWVSMEMIHLEMVKINSYGLHFSREVEESVGELAEVFQGYTIGVLETHLEEVISDIGNSIRTITFH